MKLYNISFSPTGTSAKVATAIIRGIMANIDCRTVTLDATHQSVTSETLSKDDLAIISAPVYGGKMAPLAKERMKTLTADGTPCILVAVYGNRAFENALNDMSDFTSTLGFVTTGAAAFIGEHSYSTAATPIAAGRPDDSDLEYAKAFGLEIARKISLKSLSAIDTTEITDEESQAESLANFKSFVANYMRSQKESPRKLVPEVNTEICNTCGICLSVCPTAAIADDYATIDSSKCIKCCACVKSCPEGARSLSSPFAPVLSANFSLRKSPIIKI